MFRETIRNAAEGESKWVRFNGPKDDYAHVKVRVTPLPRGSGFEFLPINKEFFPEEYFSGVEQGFLLALASGPVGGYEVTDLRAEVINGSYHHVDSSPRAFQKAAEDGMRQALQLGDPYLLEPTMGVAVSSPEEWLAVVIGLIQSCRGLVEAMEHRESGPLLRASIPELEMSAFGESLAAQTQNRATLVAKPGGYDLLPGSISRSMRFCPQCRLKVLPRNPSGVCSQCGSELGPGDDYIAV